MFFGMNGPRQGRMIKLFLAAGCLLLMISVSSCARAAGPCYQRPMADLSQALAYAGDDQLPFQFPLDELGLDDDPAPARFCKGSWGDPKDRKYHAAEDYHLPAGSPVYAFADGVISFSGSMDGYGWLIIIDHPRADIYSLYGHLSPSRWYLESGEVEKGDVIGYLGNSDENGGSTKNPLVTHLHFGIRAGQRRDYTGMGEWRWMAGWIKNCPSDLGWLQPSLVIASQEIPPPGFTKPAGGLFEKWGVEMLFSSVYGATGAVVITSALKKKKYVAPLAYAVLMVIAYLVLSIKGTRINYVLITLSMISFGISIYLYLRGKNEDQEGSAEG